MQKGSKKAKKDKKRQVIFCRVNSYNYENIWAYGQSLNIDATYQYFYVILIWAHNMQNNEKMATITAITAI